MKTAFSILVLLLLTFSGVAFAQEVESTPSESSAMESSASISESESAPESSNATTTVDAPESTPVESEVAVVEENMIGVNESVLDISPEPVDMTAPVVDFSDEKGEPVDDVIITNITPVGPVTDASDTEIIVTTGPVLQPCLPSAHCGGDRPPHVTVAQGPVTGKPCMMSNPTECNPTEPGDDDAPTNPSETGGSSSNNSSGGSDDDFLFHPAWNPFTGGGIAPAPAPQVTQLVTPVAETTGTLSEEGPDPAIVALADGRPKPPVLIVNEIPAPSPATGLFTGANASLIGTGILLLLGAFVIFRSRKK